MTDKSVYTQAMKDAGDNPEIGMLYIDAEGETCEFIGENNPSCLIIGRLTRKGIHPRHLSLSDSGDISPINNCTEEDKLIDDFSKKFRLILDMAPSFEVAFKAMQDGNEFNITRKEG